MPLTYLCVDGSIEMPYVKAVQGPGFSVIYIDEKGNKFLFSGGTWAWRNHNPGNLRPGHFSRKYGQIGVVVDQSKGHFAVFPDYETGHAALEALLKTNRYQNFTLDDAIETYAPPEENQTKKYQKFVRDRVKVDETTRIKELSSAQFLSLVLAIETIESSAPGTVEQIHEIQEIKNNKQGVIEEYFCPPLGWLSKVEAVDFAVQGRIDAVVCKPKKSPAYLRASSSETPLYKLPIHKGSS